jgi:uncharacterized protein YndB with AHSA1/START domain
MEPVVEHCTLIEASPEEVYRALATSQGLNAWFTTDSTVDARSGGSIVFRWKNFGIDRIATEDGGPVLEAVPGKVFAFQWFPAGPGNPTTVRIELSPYGSGTRVHLTEKDFPPGSDKGLSAALMVAVGWGEALTLLKYYLEQKDRYRHPCTWYEVAETQPVGQ